jgi:hypothetical protein
MDPEFSVEVGCGVSQKNKKNSKTSCNIKIL